MVGGIMWYDLLVLSLMSDGLRYSGCLLKMLLDFVHIK
jgi:hypothetical protein